jgi:hypothetical protein
MSPRRFVSVVGCAVLAALLTSLPATGAKYSGVTTNPLSKLAGATMNPPGSFTANRPCTAGAAVSPVFRAASTAATATSSVTTLTVNTPTSASGDYFIAAVVLEGNNTMNTPAGWTLVKTTVGNTFMRLSVFALAVPGSPPGSYAFTWVGATGAAAFIASYSEVASVVSTGVGTFINNSNPITISSQTPASAPSTLLDIADIYTGSTVTASTPTGMTNRPSAHTYSPGNGTYATFLWDQSLAGTSATGPDSSTLSGATWAVTTSVLLMPSPGVDPTIDLTWTVTPDTYATGYEIIRASGPTTGIVGRTTLTWSDTTTTATTAYTYTITATYLNWKSTTLSVNVLIC